MKVLLAVDRLMTGRVMAAFIGSHAWPNKTVFRIMHTIEPIRLESIDRGLIAIEKRNRAETMVSKIMESIRDRCPDTKVESKVVVGPPREAVLAMAGRWHADLVMVGSSDKKDQKSACSSQQRFYRNSISMFLLGFDCSR
ncbi:MAG: universal stress protein [Candidatus Competibacteraceae bacterium]|nr:universal stress protein [Candidatus Competibacteraceae bacterium]